MAEAQPQEEEYRGYAPQMPAMTSDRSFLAAQIDPAKLLSEIEHKLRGEKENSKGEWEKYREDPLMNEEGIGSCLLKIGTIVTQNTIFCNISERDMDSFMRSTTQSIILFLVDNVKRFKINMLDLSLIVEITTDPIYFVLKRCVNGVTIKLVQNVASEHHTEAITHIQPRKSLFSGILPK